MRNTDSYDSEPERFDANGYDLAPIIRGIKSYKRLAEWQAYARRENDDKLIEKLHKQAERIQQ